MAAPEAGLGALSLDGLGSTGRLMRVARGPFGDDPIPPPAETYVRGDDFVSTHPATESFPFRTQLVWSALPAPLAAPEGVIVTLTISLQTDLLDTAPRLALVSSVDGPMALVTDCHPTDAAEASVSAGRLVFAPPFLEKGVIRRFRAATVVSAEPHDALIEASLAWFADSPLPLTT